LWARGELRSRLRSLEVTPIVSAPRARGLELSRSRSRWAGFTSLFLWLCTICMGAGGALLAIGSVERFRKPPPPVAPRVRKGTAEQIFGGKRRPLKVRSLSGLSYFGLIAAIIFLWCCYQPGSFNPGPRSVPQGLSVHLLRPGTQAQAAQGYSRCMSAWNPADSNVRPSLYVDSQLVAWEDFATVLRKELRLRHPDWPRVSRGRSRIWNGTGP